MEINLRQWMHEATNQQREDVAKMAATTVGYLWQIARGHSKPSWRLAERLAEASKLYTPGHIISKFLLRPDIAVYFIESKKKMNTKMECTDSLIP